MTPGDFLTLLWQFKPEALYLLLWTLQGRRSHWYRDIAAAAQFVLESKGQDVYVGVGLSPQDYGPNRRCSSQDIVGIAGFWADFDLRSDAHTKKALPATIQDAISIIPASVPPTIVIASGNGAHAWWIFKEPYIFDGDDDRQAVASLASRWHTLLSLNASQRGWAYDRLADLARVLRIPGTQNLKDPANPKEVSVHSFTDRRYCFSDFQEFLDSAAIPDSQAEEKAAREWTERFTDKPLVINPSARIPQETLDRWMAADLRFRNTWQRQRHDLNDQSQSGYDLALADFGVCAGVSEQQIVDLICHHRMLHNQKARTRPDYYQRTIGRASQLKNDPVAILTAPFSPTPGAGGAPPTNGNSAQHGARVAPEDMRSPNGATPDPATSKAILCERISDILGVRVCRIVKYTGNEPTYHMQLEDGKIEFSSVAKLISRDSVRMAIAAQTGKLIKRQKPTAWEALAQAMLDACIVESGGEETELAGLGRMYVAQYLSETGFIDTIEGQPVHSQRKPIVRDDQIAICSSDLQIFICKTTAQKMSIPAVVSMLGALGAKSERVRGNFKEQSRWMLPLDQFDPAEYVQRPEAASAG